MIAKRAIAAAFLGIGLCAPPASASVILDFSSGTGGVNGTIREHRGAITGTIFLDAFTILGTAGHDSSYNISGAVLNFTTGPRGGYLSLVGSIPGLGITNDIPLISSGSFSSFMYMPRSGSFTAGGIDVVNPFVLSALGLSAGTPLQFAFTSLFDSKHNVLGTDLTTNANSPIPEPASLLLVGTGIAAFARSRRRQRAA
jgi:hypothetical protein